MLIHDRDSKCRAVRVIHLQSVQLANKGLQLSEIRSAKTGNLSSGCQVRSASATRGIHDQSTYGVPSSNRSKTVGTTTRVGTRGDIVETVYASRVNNRVEETKGRLALRDAEVVEERDNTGESLRWNCEFILMVYFG